VRGIFSLLLHVLLSMAAAFFPPYELDDLFSQCLPLHGSQGVSSVCHEALC